MKKLKVISGGQTGVDRMGLEVAKKLGLETGGTAPKGYRTEDGPDLGLKEFGLVESYSSGYPTRTLDNIEDSDGTVLFGNMGSTGSMQTIELCKAAGKPYITNPGSPELRTFLKTNEIKILNVAGNRFSVVGAEKLWAYQVILKRPLESYINGN